MDDAKGIGRVKPTRHRGWDSGSLAAPMVRDWAGEAGMVIDAIEGMVTSVGSRPECLITPDIELASAVAALACARGIELRIMIDPAMEPGKALIAMASSASDAVKEWN